MPDKFAQLVQVAEHSVQIFGNLETAEFELIDSVEFPLAEPRQLDIATRRLQFLGVVGIVDGRPRTHLSGPLNDDAISALAQAFTVHFTNRFLREGSPDARCH